MDGPLVACSMAKCCHVSYTTIEIQLIAVKSMRMVCSVTHCVGFLSLSCAKHGWLVCSLEVHGEGSHGQEGGRRHRRRRVSQHLRLTGRHRRPTTHTLRHQQEQVRERTGTMTTHPTSD